MSKVKIQGNASGTGIFTVAAPATNTDRTITLPDVDATVLTTAGGTISGAIGIGANANSGNPLTIGRVNSVNEGGQIDLCRASDNASSWGIDIYGDTSTPALRFVDNTASATRMQIDGSGRVTMPFQPSFEVGGTGGLTFTSVGASEYKLTYASVYHNIGNHYSTSTGHFTAPVTGTYLFQAVMMGVASTSPHITFSINGSAQGGGGNYPNNNLYEHGSYSQNANWIRTVHIFRLQANDYVRVQSYAYNTVGSPDRCYFGGHLLG
jgi:hypothetical protein